MTSSLLSRQGYVICAEPRSGSTFLAAILASTGVLGRPAEPFASSKDVTGTLRDPDGHLANWISRTSTGNDLYGLKVFSHHCDLVEQSRWADRLVNARFVHFRREDLLGQAISAARAQLTGQFESGQPVQGRPRYDAGLIGGALRRFAHNQARWQVWFARNGITPLSLTYEQLSADPQAAANAVAGHLSINRPVTIGVSPLGVERQRDELSNQWRERFVRERRDLGYLDDDLGRWRPIARRLRFRLRRGRLSLSGVASIAAPRDGPSRAGGG